MSESLSIHHDVGGHQFETTVDGHRAYLAYMDLGKQTLDIYRTFVPDSLRGRGIAAALTEHALQYADRMGYSVIPSCSAPTWSVTSSVASVRPIRPPEQARNENAGHQPGVFVSASLSRAGVSAARP